MTVKQSLEEIQEILNELFMDRLIYGTSFLVIEDGILRRIPVKDVIKNEGKNDYENQ